MNLKRTAAVAAVGLAAALGLSGCMRADVDLYVASDATVSGVEVTIAVDKGALEKLSSMGMSSDSGSAPSVTLEDFKTSVKSQSSGDASVVDEACEFTETDTEFVMNCAASGAEALDSVNMQSGDMTLALEDGFIKFTMATSEQQTDAASMAMLGLTGMSSTTRVHFPGDITAIAGPGATIDANDGNVAVIDMLAGDGSDVIIVAETGSGGVKGVVWLLGATGIVVLLGIAAFFLMNGNRRQDDAAVVEETVVTTDDIGDAVVERSAVVVDEDEAGPPVPIHQVTTRH